MGTIRRMARERPLTAAGAVTWRRAEPEDGGSGSRKKVEVLLVHRPRYDDWTFPKGKPDGDEDLVTTAVREVEEETGLVVRLGHPLPDTQYRVSAGPKRVSYWAARVLRPSSRPFRPNKEIDEIRWVRPGTARRLLSYPHDLDLLAAFDELRDTAGHRTRTLVVLRHAKARSREKWDKADAARPLTRKGHARAERLSDLLAAYGIQRVVTSPATRCLDTVTPYAVAEGLRSKLDHRLTEDAGPDDLRRAAADLLRRKKPTVVCGHRPTLPWLFEGLGLEAVDLEPGEGVVVHHRRGVVLGTEPLGRTVTHTAARVP